MNQYSLLAHVAPGLTTQFENLATESLLYLLQRYGRAHEAFVDVVSTTGYEPPSDLTFNTQVHMQYGNIPDLVGATTDETNVLLVDSKFWAPLTRNQPTGYLDRLPADREGMVLFIAPEGRYEELWQELLDRCRDKDLELTDETGEPPDWCVVRTSKDNLLAYASWSFVLDHLDDRLKDAGEDRGAHEVWQLRGLCQKLEAPLELCEDPWEELRSIVDEVAERLPEDLFVTKGYKATPGIRSYRRYGTLSGHKNWFVEYSKQNATDFGHSWIWVGGPSADMVGRESLPSTGENTARAHENRVNKEILFPLRVPDQTAREPVIQSLVNQVEGVAELLRQRNLP